MAPFGAILGISWHFGQIDRPGRPTREAEWPEWPFWPFLLDNRPAITLEVPGLARNGKGMPLKWHFLAFPPDVMESIAV